MPTLPRIGLVGPDLTQPCGIADYTARLAKALAGKCETVFVPFRNALADAELAGCRGILVQYERSLVPGGDFLRRLSLLHPGRVHVVPHEVYGDDPFAFPYHRLDSAFLPLLWAKRLRYLWRHREYAAEKRMQARAYFAHRVIPLSGPGAEILRGMAPGAPSQGNGEAGRVLDPVPHAFHIPPGEPGPGEIDAAGPKRFPVRPKAIIGIFGFLNPGLDYGSALDMLSGLDSGACLLLIGGSRSGTAVGNSVSIEASARGLADRVRITGYVAEDGLAAHLRACDLFLCPMRFKSNTGSLLHLIHAGKPILASDLPLTRYLRDQGAPLELYAGMGDLRAKAQAALAGAYRAPANRYPWDFDAVAAAYLRILAGT